MKSSVSEPVLNGLYVYRIYVLGGQDFFYLCENPDSVESVSDNTLRDSDVYQRGPRPLSAKEADALSPVVPLSLVLPCHWAHQYGENRSTIYPILLYALFRRCEKEYYLVLSWTLLMTSCTHIRVRAVIVPDLRRSSSRKNLKNYSWCMLSVMAHVKRDCYDRTEKL